MFSHDETPTLSLLAYLIARLATGMEASGYVTPPDVAAGIRLMSAYMKAREYDSDTNARKAKRAHVEEMRKLFRDEYEKWIASQEGK